MLYNSQNVRCIIFKPLLFFWTFICAVLFFFVGISKKYAIYLGKFWAYGSLFLLKVICNIQIDKNSYLSDIDKCNLILSKHQSAIETIFLLIILPKPAFVIKKELLKIPFYGWYLKNMGMIPVSRTISLKELKYLNENISKSIQDGRNVVIFPQGTRLPYDQNNHERKYALSYLNICKDINCKIGLVALNTGKNWTQKGKLRKGKYKIHLVKTYDIKSLEFSMLDKKQLDSLKEEIANIIENESKKICQQT